LEENKSQNQNSANAQPQMKSALVRNLLICVALLLVVLVVFWALNNTAKGKEVDVIELTNKIEAGSVSQIELDNKYIIAKYNDGTVVYINNSNDAHIKVYSSLDALKTADVDTYNKMTVVTGSSTTFSILNLIYPILMVVLLFVVFKMLLKQIGAANNKSFDFVKNRARILPSTVKFTDVAGADEEKAELEEIIEFLRAPDRFIKMGARIPKGVLLVGQPGTGKTLLAKACAGEANVPFFSISGSDFMELFVGVGASRVRDLFETAKKAKPCIIFIDEIDAIGRQRGAGMGGGNDEREQTLNQLLVQMDGFESNDGIIVLAATNRVDILDPALLRPGRFDRRIFINPPDVKGREEILKVHSKHKPLDKDVNLQHIARITSGFTGADIENMLNESALLAAKRKQPTITMENINDAIAKVTMGPQKKSYVITEHDKIITATHEAGHAIIGKCVKHSDPVHEVSIVPRGNAGGYTLSRPDNDDRHILKG
jgi:cell division protease FtsH